MNRALRSKNRLIELVDIFIASTAVANDLSLATMNTKHFDRIESLKIIELRDEIKKGDRRAKERLINE